MFTKASVLAVFASIAAAQVHAPVGQPSGNPISAPLNQVVDACVPFTIKWTPTTPNSVSVLLLKGPSTNVVKFGPALAEGIANSGSLAWTPASDLEATNGPMGYGIQIIDDVTGQYQYSTQFGISKEKCGAVSSAAAAPSPSPSASPAASQADYPASSPSAPAGYPVASASKEAGYPVAPSSLVYVPAASKSVVSPPYPTAPAGNSTVPATGTNASIQPTATGNATTNHLPESTGAASALQAGLSFAGVAAALAFML